MARRFWIDGRARAWPVPSRLPLRWLVTWLLSVSLAWVVLGRVAAQSEDPEALLQAGVALRREGDNRGALTLFERAQALSPSARASAQIALAHHALGHWVTAEEGLSEVLERAGDDPWIARHRGALALALETVRDHLGTLHVEANVARALVSIDGREVGQVPLPDGVRVPAGEVAISVRAPGYAEVHGRAEVPPRGVAKATFVLVPSAAPANDRGDAEAGADPAQASPSGQQAPAVRLDASDDATNLRRGGHIALIAAAPLLVGAVVAHTMREVSAHRYADDARCFYGDQSRDQRCGGLRSEVETTETIAIVGYVGAGVALSAGLSLLLLSSSHEAGTSQARVTPTWRAGGPGLHYHRVF